MAYERVNWENLPSTKTPINQTNLTKMENGIDQAGAEIFVGAEEPTTGEKVWFRKGNNLLDKSKFIFNKSLNVDTGTIDVSTGGNWYAIEEYIYFKQYAGKTVSLSSRLTVAFYDSNKKYISSIVARINPTEIVPTNAVYIRADVYKDYYDVVQLEIGNTPTEYQPYVEPQIFIKNSNGVYEEANDVYTKTETDTKLNKKQEKLTAGTGIEITGTNIINNLNANYSTDEIRIGTWIDGKPIYRKVFYFGQLPVASRKEIRHGISDLSRIIKLYGIASWNTADMPTIPLPSADPDGEKYSIYLSANSSIIAVTTGSDRGDFYGYVVMEYIKK